ncbi:riboflavin synthase [Halorarum halophilum]|uniref:Riboflavin synthase n=1 Tax=Halorarum halophilum TaxID=2743090 RepID=A0A7D5GHE8_9EURY|nr:riboflavin synthase [Halobaculum halophilum]QLG29130.1 riboflavin synthase [Halobaculum halophilum]
MFTGIVETTGEVLAREETEDGVRLRVGVDGFDDLHHGQSISVSGVCLTVEAFGEDGADGGGGWFETFLAAETVAKTYLGELREGDAVNLERALAADGRFDGHVVQGHVDTTTRVTAVEEVGEDWRFSFALPPEYAKYVVDKGSVTLDGISLTVADRRPDEFDVAVIPATYDLTNLSGKDPGDPVHLEVDVVAKYVENMLEGYAESTSPGIDDLTAE